MEQKVNEEKRNKFIEFAGKRVNNVLHDIQILEPMARSNSYDFTKQDVEEMFAAMQETLNAVKAEYEKKSEELHNSFVEKAKEIGHKVIEESAKETVGKIEKAVREGKAEHHQ